ncbi:MAG: hypothetical protein AAGE98_03705 [Actinomycetota bacterium]
MKRILLLLLGVVLIAAACGGDDGDTAATAAPAVVVENADSDTTETAPAEPVETETTEAAPADDAEPVEVAADATDEELALAFADCMRDEGIDFPDPVVAADGSITLIDVSDPSNLPFDPDDPAFDTATDVCGPLLQGASFLPGADGDLTEIEDDLLAFAGCLRDLGFDVDDPDLSGGFGGGPAGLFGENFDPTDPANADAIQECQLAVFGAAGPQGGE